MSAGQLSLLYAQDRQGQHRLAGPHYAYDAAGNLTSLVNPLEQNQTYGYDGLDRLTSWTLGAQTETYLYDELGNWLGVNSPTATYPPSGPGSVRPHALQTFGGRTYSYDANGNVTGVTGDLTRSLTYDVENRPVSTEFWGQSDPTGSFRWPACLIRPHVPILPASSR